MKDKNRFLNIITFILICALLLPIVLLLINSIKYEIDQDNTLFAILFAFSILPCGITSVIAGAITFIFGRKLQKTKHKIIAILGIIIGLIEIYIGTLTITFLTNNPFS